MAKTYNEWLAALPFVARRDARGKGIQVNLSTCVYASGFTALSYHHDGANADSEQGLNGYTEAERAFRAVWEEARKRANETKP